MPSDFINLEDLYVEQGGYNQGTTNSPGDGGGGADPYAPGNMNPSQHKGGDPNIANMPPQDKTDSHPDEDQGPYNDPQTPDMPQEKEHMDFEKWKKEFLKGAIKGDVQEMKQMILDIRERDLNPYQRKFVEDNLQILFLREQSNIEQASKQIRSAVKQNLDQNNPGTSLVDYMGETLDKIPMLNSVFIKLNGLYGIKQPEHRKFIASLIGAVQVGDGASTEDLVYSEKDYSIKISTRMNARFGDFYLGNWSLRKDDPSRYLKPPELQRLQDGSPEEKEVLRKRVVMESIAEMFKERAFIMNVVSTDGTIHTIGWDIATSLKTAYTEGRLVVRTNQDDGSDAMITDDGEIISFVNLMIKYVKDTGEIDEEDKPVKKEIEFINWKTGQLYLTSSLHILKEASGAFPGLKIKEQSFTGNPSDLTTLMRCVPSVPTIIMGQCV